jgi:serine/threonine protein kinase
MAELFVASLSVPAKIKLALSELSKKYVLEREVTKGANGYLFFGKNRVLGTTIAVKIYYWGSDKRYHAEPQHLAQINSPNVLSVFDAGYIDSEWAYFVTPFCIGGDLDDLLSRMDVGNLKAIDITTQILSGLSFLHADRLLHRDLKPANIYLDENNAAVIGDFGSLKRLPEGQTSIPSSSHALLYRPPESIDTNEYCYLGDVYQAGMVFYQLLGGNLSYEETSWLTKQELAHYNQLKSPADKSIYIDQCIHAQIKKGKVVKIDSLPPWVSDNIRKVLRKACHVDRNKRFASPADLMAKLNEIRPHVRDWCVICGCPTVVAPTSYRITVEEELFRAQKRKGDGQWRNDFGIVANSLSEVVNTINEKI